VNFGDILEKWERGQPNASQNNSMETWLKENGIFDKDANAKRSSVPGEKRRRLMRIQPDDIIDIHGYTSEKAWLALDQFFTNAKNSGFEKLRIIHGKGNRSQGEAVLGQTVRKFIEQCLFAGETGYEKSANGGTGATWVFLKD
jgi:DNA-nicking Smr family endonuclease